MVGAGWRARQRQLRALLRRKAKAAGEKARRKYGVKADAGRIRKLPGMSTDAGGVWRARTVKASHDVIVRAIAAARVRARAGGFGGDVMSS